MLTPDFVAKVQTGSPVNSTGAPGSAPQNLSDDSSYNAWKSSIASPAQGNDGGQNLLQKILSFTPINAVADVGTRVGQAAAEVTAAGADAVGAHGVAQHIDQKLAQPVKNPISGDMLEPANQITPEKEAGRALNTVAWGIGGPTAAGAAMGAGNALQSGAGAGQTAVETIAGALGGKILEHGFKAVSPLIEKAAATYGKPVLDQIAHLVPDSAKAGFQALAQKVANVVPEKIMPDAASAAVNKGAEVVNTAVEKPFQMAGDAVKALTPDISAARQSRIVGNRVDELSKLESGNAVIRKAIATAKGKGIDVKDIVANTDLLHNSVDNNGTIRTTQPGGAVEQLTHFIQPQEDVISKTLQREGKTIPFSDLEKQLTDSVNNSSVKGGAKLRAQQNVAQDIKGYMLDAVDSEGKPWVEGTSVGEPQIPLATVHDAKVDKYSNVDYANPESQKTDKVIAKTLKQVVEKNTDSADAKQLNAELARHYATLNFLEKLDGRKVEGGRLGKYFAQTVGGMVGSHFGPLGTIAGAEAGGLIKGGIMKSKFGSAIGKDLEQSPAMKEAIQANEAHSNKAGSRKSNQSTTAKSPNTSI